MIIDRPLPMERYWDTNAKNAPRVRTPFGWGRLLRPSPDAIFNSVNLASVVDLSIVPPDHESDRWNEDNRDWILRYWLPAFAHKLDRETLSIIHESYLTDVLIESSGVIHTYEQVLCDGSTAVLDIMHPCGVRIVKDPPSVPHDYLFDLRRLGLRSISYWREWTLEEAHRVYRDLWRAAGRDLIALERYVGLELGGWALWAEAKADTRKINYPEGSRAAWETTEVALA